jgi:hypothetical protein
MAVRECFSRSTYDNRILGARLRSKKDATKTKQKASVARSARDSANRYLEVGRTDIALETRLVWNGILGDSG